jgi:hypothetical protein
MLPISIDEVRLWLIIPKSIVAMLFFLSANRIYKKEHLINRIFSWAFIIWGIYMVIDAFVFTFAPLNTTIFYICRVLWGIQLFCLLLYAILILNATKIIKWGEYILKNRRELLLEIILFFVLASGLIIFSPLQIADSNGTQINPELLPVNFAVYVKEGFTPISMVISVTPFIVYFVCAGILFVIARKTEDVVAKRKMYLLIIGILMIPLGLIYFLLRSLFFPIYTFPVSVLGQLFYMLAPPAILFSLKK